MKVHLLIIGFGYTARYLAKKAHELGMKVTATTRDSTALGYHESLGCELISFTNQALEKALINTTHLLISTPPLAHQGDPVLLNFTELLTQHAKTLQWIGYLSSTSVYGNHDGNWVDESSQLNAQTGQGKLRRAAEEQWIKFATEQSIRLTVFRLAGIYGPQRNVLARLRLGKKDTVVKQNHYFSRIHVDDIVQVIIAAMLKLEPGIELYNVADDAPTPGNSVDQYAAALLNLPALKEIAYETANLSPMAHEFYTHNKRISNAKLKQQLISQLIYPTYKEGLAGLLSLD